MKTKKAEVVKAQATPVSSRIGNRNAAHGAVTKTRMISVRMTDTLYKEITSRAKKEGISSPRWILNNLNDAVGIMEWDQ